MHPTERTLTETLDTFTSAVLSRAEGQALPIFTATTAANLKVYRHNWLFGMLSALQRRYPTVEKVVQVANFKFLAREYIAQYPSRVSNIDDYGANFAPFLLAREELQGLPYLRDIALLDDVYYRNDPHYHVHVGDGCVTLWHNIRADNPAATVNIDLARQQRVSCVYDDEGNLCLKIWG